MINLSTKQQIKLLKLARKTIANKLKIELVSDEIDFNDSVFNEKCGAFVTIHINENLRGCIGYIEGNKSIIKTIEEVSLSSAFRDPRFKPLSISEYEKIDIEISLLSPMEEVMDVDEIVVGRDGVIISKGRNRGLLLPQVPLEQGWDRDTFLENASYKAGLPGDAWKSEGIKIEKFSAQIFSEKKLGIFK